MDPFPVTFYNQDLSEFLPQSIPISFHLTPHSPLLAGGPLQKALSPTHPGWLSMSDVVTLQE